MKIAEFLEKYFKDEALTEDAKSKMKTIFEAAVTEAADKKIAEVIAEKESSLEEECKKDLQEWKENLVSKLNEYMSYTIEEFVKENELSEVSDIKVKMADAFIEKILGAVKENYVEISEEQIDVVTDLEKQIKELKEKIDSSTNDKISLKRQLFEYEKAIAFEKLSAGLSENEKDKLLNLVEDIEASDINSFKTKLNVLKSAFIKKESNDEIDKENLDESIDNKNDKKDPLKKYLPTNKRRFL